MRDGLWISIEKSINGIIPTTTGGFDGEALASIYNTMNLTTKRGLVILRPTGGISGSIEVNTTKAISLLGAALDAPEPKARARDKRIPCI